jgi:hypothetical protein
MILEAGVSSGATGLPVSLTGDSKVTVSAFLPKGSTLIVGRGRIRSASSQAALAAIFTPPDLPPAGSPPRASGFLVALGIGEFLDPSTQKVTSLGCGGASSQSYLQFQAGGALRVESQSIILPPGQQILFQAPQLANLGDSMPSSVVSDVAYVSSETEAGDYSITFKKTGDGEGTVDQQVGGTSILPAPVAVSKTKTAGLSMACELSYLACVETCKRGLGDLIFKTACTEGDCGTLLTPSGNQALPQPVDFQDSESCRQTAVRSDSCNNALKPEAPTSIAYRVATNEVFGAAPNGNQFFLQLVRSTTNGATPRVTRIVITP